MLKFASRPPRLKRETGCGWIEARSPLRFEVVEKLALELAILKYVSLPPHLIAVRAERRSKIMPASSLNLNSDPAPPFTD